MALKIPPIDLAFLVIEKPDAPMHVGTVMLFDRPKRRQPGLGAQIVRTYRAARPFPPFNRIPDLSMSGMPRWQPVRNVDPEYHVQHLILPPGATERTFHRLIADLHEPVLDRARPGFRVWVIEGLPDDRFAIYCKVHHSLIDGLSFTVRVVASLARRQSSATRAPFFAVDVGAHRAQPPASLRAELASIAETALKEASAIGDVATSLAKKAWQALVARQVTGSRPFAAADLPLNAPIRAPRSFATLALPLADMRTVAHAFGGTINDVAAAAVDAGIQRYLAATGQPASKPLVAMCPVSLRAAGDTTATTNVAAMFVPLGEPNASPAERMRQVIAAMSASKAEIRGMSRDAALVYAASIFGLAALAELTRAQRITGPAANFVLSNVPGAPDERYLGGARLRAVFPVSLVASGMGLNVTLTSHFDTMGIGFVANRAVLPDPGMLAAHTRQAFDELSEAAFALAASDWPTRGRRRRARPPARRRV